MAKNGESDFYVPAILIKPSCLFYCINIATTHQVKKIWRANPLKGKVVKIGKIHEFCPQTHLFFHLRSLNIKNRWPNTVNTPYNVWGLNPGRRVEMHGTFDSLFWSAEGTVKIGCRTSFMNIASSPHLENFQKSFNWKSPWMYSYIFWGGGFVLIFFRAWNWLWKKFVVN